MMDCKIAMVLVATVFLPVISSATDYVVGDSAGWTLGVNYTEWAWGKEFNVGDKLIFNYKSPNHTVAKVDGPNFRACTAPAGGDIMTSGADEVEIKTPGRKWYLCTKGNHCKSGMKLFINVAEAWAPAPAPAAGAAGPTGTSAKTAAFGFGTVVAAAVALAIVI